MHFVYRTTYQPHGNGQCPDWCLIDFKEKGLKTGWRLDSKYNKEKHAWGHDIYNEIKANPENFLIVEAEDYDHLQMTKEYKEKWNEYVLSAIDPNSNLGWIAPDGTFIGCSYYDHSFIAENYLHSSEEQLEATGWCKVYALGEPEAENNELNYFTKNNHFTAAQKEMIHRHNEKFPYKGFGFGIKAFLRAEAEDNE